MSTRRNIWLLLSALACGASGPALAQNNSTGQPPSNVGTISSSGQRGGITGYIVGPVTYNEAPATDARTRQLVSALNTFRTGFMTQLRQTLTTSGYVYFVDVPQSGAEPRNRLALYMIFASEGSDPDYEPVCAVNERVSLGGLAGYFPGEAPAASGAQTANIQMRTLTRADRPLLQRLCDGLARPVSSLNGRGGRSREASGRTVYDHLSRDTGVLVFMLMPGRMYGQDISTDLARYFWAAALVGRYHRVPSGEEFAADPAIYEQMQSMEDGGTAEFAMPVPFRVPPGSSGVAAYPPDARREFGGRLDSLDADWLRYLAGAAVTIRGRQMPLMNGDRPAAILPIFSLEQIGTPAFWLASSDATRTYEMVACIGGRFLSDRYEADASAADMGRCAMAETSLPARGE